MEVTLVLKVSFAIKKLLPNKSRPTGIIAIPANTTILLISLTISEDSLVSSFLASAVSFEI